MSEDRWSDQGPSCPYCGHRIVSGWVCTTCDGGELVLTPETHAPRIEAPGHGGLKFTPEEIAEYQATTEAFDAAQRAESEIVPEEERELDEMPIIAKETGSNFKPAPAGTAMGVCVDVVDLGMVKMNFPGKPETLKHMIRVVWQLGEVDAVIGKRPLVSQRYTLSLHEKANLRKDLESWRGRPFTAAERQGFDVEKVVGVPCVLNIVHSADGQYANVAAIMPVMKGMTVPKPDGYVRVKDRPTDAPEREPGSDDHDDPAADDAGFHAAGLDEGAPF